MHYQFTNYVAGKPSGENLPRVEIDSLDGSVVVAVPDSDLTELIAARDFVTRFGGVDPHARIANSKRGLTDRISIVRSVYTGFQERQDELIDLVHKIHGTPEPYLAGSCEKLEAWVGNLEAFAQRVDGFSTSRDGISFDQRQALTPYALVSAGNFEIYESFYLLAQTILSGTHFIIRPSAYDITTHIIFEILAEQGLADLGQKITWDSTRRPGLIRHLLRFVQGASIFGSDEQIQKILVTSVLERHPDGRVEERIFDDLSRGRQVRAYGSGNAMLVVLGHPEEAAKHFYYAKVLAKGNKCWVPDGAIVLDDYVDRFCDRLIELDQANAEHLPGFRQAEIEAMSGYIEKTIGRLDYGTYHAQRQTVGIMLAKDLDADSPFFAQEVTFPAAGIVPVREPRDVIETLRKIITRRGASAYLSVGYFGPETDFAQIRARVPSEAYHSNESLVVDLMAPHQGSFFTLDPTTIPGGHR